MEAIIFTNSSLHNPLKERAKCALELERLHPMVSEMGCYGTHTGSSFPQWYGEDHYFENRVDHMASTLHSSTPAIHIRYPKKKI